MKILDSIFEATAAEALEKNFYAAAVSDKLLSYEAFFTQLYLD